MKKLDIRIEGLAYSGPEELEEKDRLLLEEARSVLSQSYSPYSNFKVGASVLLENGEILSGANYENASYPMCICAEQGVLAAANSRFPNVPVKAIAITIKSPDKVVDQPAAPCGACRQVICETEFKYKQAIRVIIQGETGPVWVFEKGADLLPLGFDGSYL